MKDYNIYIIDDDEGLRFAIKNLFIKNRIAIKENIFAYSDGESFLSKFSPENKSIIILDYQLPGMNGLFIVDKILNIQKDAYIIFLTGFGNEKLAIKAIRKGVYDYIAKPFNNEELLNIISHIIEKISLLKKIETEDTGFYFSDKIKKIIEKVKTVAQSDAPVLFIGETGTGKELFSKMVHNHSKRKGKLISINCSAIPENLFEYELFGAEKGAFTGAYKKRTGFFELADKGTLFFDEIGDMPLPLQAKLLRVLQESIFYRIGGSIPVKIDVRIVSSTNKDLQKLVKEGKFRNDLYYRISTFSFHIPPLRERKDDIIPLAKLFLQQFSKKYKKFVTDFDTKVYNFLLSYPWPGNIRELKNFIEKIVILTNSDIIRINDIKEFLYEFKDNINFDMDNNNIKRIKNIKGNIDDDNINIYPEGHETFEIKGFERIPETLKEAKKLFVEEFERKFIYYHLKKNNFNVAETARKIGMYRQDLYKKIKHLGLKK